MGIADCVGLNRGNDVVRQRGRRRIFGVGLGLSLRRGSWEVGCVGSGMVILSGQNRHQNHDRARVFVLSGCIEVGETFLLSPLFGSPASLSRNTNSTMFTVSHCLSHTDCSSHPPRYQNNHLSPMSQCTQAHTTEPNQSFLLLFPFTPPPPPCCLSRRCLGLY